MRFDSPTFLVAAVLVLLLHHVLPWRSGRVVLLVASYLFYGVGNVGYAALLAATTLVDFAVAIGLERLENPTTRRALLAVSLAGNLGVLALFKYADFAVWNVNVAFGWIGLTPLSAPGWLLPVGISFYTFQTLSYVIDVYRRRLPACRDPIHFALYVAYFPQLVAGPIERASHLLPQLAQKQVVVADDLTAGLTRILIGLFKKVALADRLRLAVDPVYAAPASATAAELALATIYFTFQMYLDFAAYTDIAIGLGRMMGVSLSENFAKPLLALNPSHFWRRWHMTLTRWFRDYVHTPMGGLVPGRPWHRAAVTVVTMTLIGLWHGASFTFMLFGFAAGLELAAHQLIHHLRGDRPMPRLATSLGIVVHLFIAFVLSSLFRAPSVPILVEVWRSLVTHAWELPSPARALLVAPIVVGVLAMELLDGRVRAPRVFALPAVRGLALALLACVVLYGAVDGGEAFIYFRF